MTPPTVRVNTYMQGNEKRSVDHLSKMFIAIEFACGLNRVPVLSEMRPTYTRLAFLYTLVFNCAIIYMFICSDKTTDKFFVNMKLIQFMFCCIFGFFSWKRMRQYYEELEKFDIEIGHAPNISSESIMIVLQMILISAVLISLFAYGNVLEYLPIYLIHNVENNYYGYLLNLLIRRLRLINNYVESSVSNAYSANSKNKGDKIINVPMNKLIDFYHILINAYDLLIDAIKWQFLVMLTTSFSYLLLKSYGIALNYINTSMPFVDALPDIGAALTEMIPLLAPCMCCDYVRAEVRRLRELLASKLYENKIDKPSRSIARALLALTETRNLSFSLLRMVDISISLPFTFLGLLVTYLIIMLQFQKVISPS